MGNRDVSDRAPRVLHIINGEYFGGAARVLTNYLTAPTRRADVTVMLHFEGELLDRLRELHVPVELVPMRSRLDIAASRHVYRFARRWGADLVHTHQLRNTLLARLASLAGGPKVVTHVHSPAFRESTRAVNNRLTGLADRILAARSRMFIAVSNSLRDELLRLKIPAHRIRVIPNGIPLPTASSPAARAELHGRFGIANEFPIVGLVANLRPRKGAEILMRAAAELKRAQVPVHLLFVGEAFRGEGRDYQADLASLGHNLKIVEQTTFAGFQRDTDGIIAGLDVFVLPSLFGEGLPMALLEAMGAGVPAVSTPVEGIADLVKDGRNGLLVPAGEVTALASAIRRLLTDSEFAATIARYGRDTVSEHHSADVMARSIEAVNEDLL